MAASAGRVQSVNAAPTSNSTSLATAYSRTKAQSVATDTAPGPVVEPSMSAPAQNAARSRTPVHTSALPDAAGKRARVRATSRSPEAPMTVQSLIGSTS
jgi:hypothetical protein